MSKPLDHHNFHGRGGNLNQNKDFSHCVFNEHFQLKTNMNPSDVWSAVDESGNCIGGDLVKSNCEEKKFVVCSISGRLVIVSIL